MLVWQEIRPPNRLTDLATSFVVNKLYNYLNVNHFSIATFLDLSKLFDIVNHDILMRTLCVRGIALYLFKDSRHYW